MAQINVNDLTFAYEGSFDNIFENTSFSIDTDWKLGLVGRNGKLETKEAREIVKKYLKSKKGFILVSHDRDVLDACIDHILVLNRASIEVQSGNFSSWWENKKKADIYARAQNEKHLREIGKLKAAADRAGRWAEKNENTKIGFNPIEEHDRFIDTRSYIGAKTKKMQKRVKSYENRLLAEIEEKEGLLNDIEEVTELKIMPLKYHKERLLFARDYSLKYKDAVSDLFGGLTFEINNGDRVVIDGENGCGKSSLIKAILDANRGVSLESRVYQEAGTLEVPGNLTISYINQDTSHLNGLLRDYCETRGLDYTP